MMGKINRLSQTRNEFYNEFISRRNQKHFKGELINFEYSEISLKPCPFCGGTDLYFQKDYQSNGFHCIECASLDCGCLSPQKQTIELVVEAWNNRQN